MMRVLTLLAVGALACDRAPTRIEVSPVADGEWNVLHIGERGAILRQGHAPYPDTRTRGTPRPAGIALLTDRFTQIQTDTVSFNAGGSSIDLIRVADGDSYLSADGGPRLIQSPVDPRLYAFEHDHAIWLFRAPDSIKRLTTNTGYDSLAAKQREGVVILYWTVDPMWSGDGEFISFMTNRNSVRDGTQNQGIWAVDIATGIEKAVFDLAGVSVHTDGAYGEEFVFSSSATPGVATVHPRTKTTTRRGDGYLLASEPHGRAMLINNEGRLILFRSDNSKVDTLAPPPTGMTWSTSARLSPSGERVAIFATDNTGKYRLHVLGPAISQDLSTDLPGLPSYGPMWVSESAIVFAATPLRSRELKTYRAQLK